MSSAHHSSSSQNPPDTSLGDERRLEAVRLAKHAIAQEASDDNKSHDGGVIDVPAADHGNPLDRLADLARQLLNVPIALVSLVDKAHQYFSGVSGLPEPLAATRQSPISHSMCQHVVRSGGSVVITDARQDDRVRDNPVIRDFNVIAYCGVPLTTTDGHVLGSLCVMAAEPRDWTETEVRVLSQMAEAALSELELRRQLRQAKFDREEVDAARDRAVDALRERDTAIAKVGHELRNSINPALLAVQLLASDERLPESLRSEIEMIRRSIGLEGRLVSDLLDTSRARHGRLNLDRMPIDLADLVREVVKDCQSDAKASEISLITKVAGSPGRQIVASVDSDRIRQLLDNLVGNALKFTDASGSITVTCDSDEQMATICVEDNGHGIESESMPTLFDPFVQGGSQAQRKSGLGLGLAICRGIAEAHGGTIEGRSVGLGKGSAFQVKLPLV